MNIGEVNGEHRNDARGPRRHPEKYKRKCYARTCNFVNVIVGGVRHVLCGHCVVSPATMTISCLRIYGTFL